jgi:hypothetical protein
MIACGRGAFTHFAPIWVTLQRHLQNMLFYHKGLGVRKKPLPFVICARKAAILRVQIWAAHSSDVVGVNTPNSSTLPCLYFG